MESNNELDALALQAGLVDGEAAAGEPGAMIAAQEADQTATLADENSQAVGMILGLAGPALGVLYPSLPGVFTPEACDKLAAAYGPLLAKYDINLGLLGGAWKEEISAAFVTWPIAMAALAAIRADAARDKRPAPAAAQVASGAASPRRPMPGDVDYREAVAEQVL